MAENETSADPGLQLKKRARRRLVGAAALALLAIIVLPVVMDHEPRPPLQDIQVRIPSQDSEGLAPLPAPKPTIPNPTTPNPTTPNPASLPPSEPGATPAAAPPSGEAAAAPLTPPIPAMTPAVAEPAAEVAQQPQQQWVVQLGTYKDAGNVKNLLTKLQEMHVPAYTEKIDADKGARTRVRAGPFTSREAAEKAQTRIKKIGVNGTVAVK